MNSDIVDLVYCDPPFNKGQSFHAPAGSPSEGASFQDRWHENIATTRQYRELAETHPELYRYIDAVEGVGSRSAKWYLIFMAVRLIEIHRVLKPDGSIFLHCDPTANYLLRGVMDAIFGYQNFRNEIVWCYTGPGNVVRWFPRKHDTLLFYVKDETANPTFNIDAVRIPYKKLNVQHQPGGNGGIGGKLTSETIDEYRERGKPPEDYWLEGRDGMSPVGRIPSERLGYPTQKPLALLDRIIQVASNPGDMVLDPFCGCGTTCVSAHLNDRQWIGIDCSEKAYELAKERISNLVAQGRLQQLIGTEINYYDQPPRRTDSL